MEKVLITGATGFVGRSSLTALLARGGEVHAAGRSVATLANTGARVHPIDLLDPQEVASLMATLRPSHLLHLAWTTTPGAYWTSAENLQWVDASEHLLRCFAENGGRRAVVAGSCAEYDWAGGCCHETTTPLRPASLYGACKNDLRQRLDLLARETGLDAAWGRLFFLYGPREHPLRLVAAVINALLQNAPAFCSSGTQRRDFLLVDDAAEALVALLASDVIGAVNIASGEAVSVAAIVQKIAALLGKTELVRLGARPSNAGEPPLLVADVRRLREDVGWSPRFRLDEGLADAIDWWRGANHAATRAA